MYHLLVGVKNSDELSTASTKIFRLKRQIQTLQHSKNMCANVTIDNVDNLDDFPAKEGNEYLSAKHQVVKENFMNSKFLNHKDDDDDFVSPIIKESELDDDDEDTRAGGDSGETNNDEVNFSIDESEPSPQSNTDPGVPGEQRDIFPLPNNHKLEQHWHDVTAVDKDPIKAIHAKVDSRPFAKSIETYPQNTHKGIPVVSTSLHFPKEDRLTSEFSMINDDVISFNNDLRLDLPDKRTS